MDEKYTRAFICINFPNDVIKEVARIQSLLENKFIGKLTELENLHLTLKFLEQIKDMLRGQGYPAYISNNKDVCVRGIANVKRWFDDIGSSNSRNLLKYEYFLKHGYLPARLLG